LRYSQFQELIEQNGLGIIFSMESGPVLFSTNHVWADGVKVDVEEAHEYVKTGSNVNFIEHIVENPDFDIISPECILRQAIGVWIGSKPSKFWRLSSNKGHLEELERNRREFVDRIRNADFLSLDLVRSGGKIAGYLSKHIGIISTRDTPSGRPTHVFFHTTDAYVFREAIVLENDEDIFDVLPVGLAVRFDARVTRLNFCKEVKIVFLKSLLAVFFSSLRVQPLFLTIYVILPWNFITLTCSLIYLKKIKYRLIFCFT